mgnify:CR=1 FL=1
MTTKTTKRRRSREPGRATTQKSAAKALGVNVRSLREWERAAWFPSDGRTADGWDVDAIKSARAAAGLEASDARGAELAEARANAGAIREGRKRLDGIRAEILSIRNGLASKTLLVRRESDIALAEILTCLRDELEQMPELIGRLCCRTCRPRFERALDEAFTKRQNAAPDRLRKTMQDWDAANGNVTTGPMPPIALPSDAAIAERLKVILGRCELLERKLRQQEAEATPTAGHWVVRDEILAIVREIVVEPPGEALLAVQACCRDDVGIRRELDASLDAMLRRSETLFEAFERKQGIERPETVETALATATATETESETAEATGATPETPTT